MSQEGQALSTVQAAKGLTLSPRMQELKVQAEVLIRGGMLPAAYRGKPDAVMTAMLFAMELGVSPVRGINAIHVIEGRPSISANLMLSLVRERIPTFEMEVVEATAKKNVVRHRRRPDRDWSVCEYTIEEAQAANLTGKDNWKRHPTDMLFARNTSRMCRWSYPDVLHGFVHTPEELEESMVRSVSHVREVTVEAAEKAKVVEAVVVPATPAEDKVNEEAVFALVDTMQHLSEERAMEKAWNAFCENNNASPATISAAWDAYQNRVEKVKATQA